MRRSRLSILSATLVLSSAGAVVSSCTNEPTEIVTGVTTQIQISKDLEAVVVFVRYGGTPLNCELYSLTDGNVTLPSTLGLVPQEARDGEVLEPVTVTVLGFRQLGQAEAFWELCSFDSVEDEAGVAVLRRRRMAYQDERILFMPMPLRESCTGVFCADDETCLGGKCEPMDLADDQVVDYSDSLIFGNTNTCFDPSVCLAPGLAQPAVLIDPDTCTFRYPVPPDTDPPQVAAGSLNVEIVYHSMGTEILDLDDKEGFVFPDENDPLTFRLAENLCESNYQAGKILGVFAAPGCAAKRALQPICDDDLADIQAGLRAPVSSASEPLCTVGDPLVPSESALYVLLDRSLSMEDLYGPDGLEFAVGVPLRNPVSARTRLALSFLPADDQSCTNGAFETPGFGFDDVENVRQPIADALGDPGTLLADDPMLYLDGAMTGAYTALAALTPIESARFNRRALIVVGNRDLQSHCAPTLGDPATLASDALANDNLFTYVAVLDAPASAQQFGDDPQTSAATIASAGGTEVFDAIADEAEGGLAVQKVLNDLGSCVYDRPGGVGQADATHLSYVNPVTLERADIGFNEACDGEAAATSVDGWGFESDGAVRICGAPCAALRDTLTETAAFYAALGQPAPRVPIVTALPCFDPNRFKLPPD